LTAKTRRGAERFPDALVRAGQLRETTPTENHRSSRIAGGWADNPTSVKNMVSKSKEVKMGKASKKGQGPPRAVKPMATMKG